MGYLSVLVAALLTAPVDSIGWGVLTRVLRLGERFARRNKRNRSPRKVRGFEKRLGTEMKKVQVAEAVCADIEMDLAPEVILSVCHVSEGSVHALLCLRRCSNGQFSSTLFPFPEGRLTGSRVEMVDAIFRDQLYTVLFDIVGVQLDIPFPRP
jgi:hypothetical protein